MEYRARLLTDVPLVLDEAVKYNYPRSILLGVMPKPKKYGTLSPFREWAQLSLFVNTIT